MKIRLGAGIVLTVILLSIASIACSSSPASPSPEEPVFEPPPGVEPVAPDVDTPIPSESEMVEVLAPIDGVEINIAESFPPQYFVHVRSGLPNGCHKFSRNDVSRDGDIVRIAVTNLKHSGPVVCTDNYGTTESNIALGSDFVGGTTYTVHVNDTTETFVAQGGAPQPLEPEGPAMISVPAPLEKVEIVVSDSNPPQYALKIVSGLPGGCVKFDTYELSRDGNSFAVTVANLEPASPVPCITIYGYHRVK